MSPALLCAGVQPSATSMKPFNSSSTSKPNNFAGKGRMVRRKDQFWEYAEDLKGRFVCKFCHKNYPGGIARVKSHLSRLQGRDIAVCNSVPEDVQALALTAVSGKDFPCKKRKLVTAEGDGVALSFSPVSSCPDSSMELQENVSLAPCSNQDKELVDRLVGQFFIMNNIALNVIQSPSFQAMVKAIAKFGSGYSLPSCSTFCTKLVTDVKKEVEEYVSKVKGSWSLTGCTLMSDIWTGVQDHSFINVIAYSPKGVVFLRSFEKNGEKNIGAYLGDALLSSIKDIGPENVVQIVVNDACSDNFSDDLISEKYPHIYITKCAFHGVELLLQDIYKDVEWIRGVFDDAKLIVDYVYDHPTVLNLIRAHTGNKELRKPSKAIIASHFLMLLSILEVEENLCWIVTSPEWNDMSVVDSAMRDKFSQVVQSVSFWSQGKDVITAFEPLIRVLRLVDSEGSTAGYLYEAMERVRVKLEQRCSSDPLKYSKLLKLFMSRRNTKILHKIHAAAAFLNPSLMYDGKVKYEHSDVRDGMNFVLETMVTQNEMDDFAAQLLLYSGKSSNLFNTLSVLMMKKAHPRVWWEYNGAEVPLLRKVAIRILSQPCSSSSCRRNWGAFEVAQTKMINKMSQDVLEDLIYMKMNSKMMANHSQHEMRDKSAINLEELELFEDKRHKYWEFDNEEGISGGLDDTSALDVGNDLGSSSFQLPNNFSDAKIS